MPAKYRGLNSPPGSTGHRGLNVVPVEPVDAAAYTAIQFGDVGKQTLKAMRRAMATMASEGVNLLIDDIILETEFLDDYLSVMETTEIYFVGVKCPAEVINQRESMRPGRFPGTAVGHMDICHAHSCYDVEVDTSQQTPEQCAEAVIARLQAGPATAFTTLRLR